MKIAVWYNLPSGGAKRALYNHVRALVERGHTVEAWCPPTADRTYLPLGELVREHVVPATRRRASSPYSPSNLLRLRTVNMLWLEENDEYARLCAEEINRGDFDLLFANTSLEIAVSSIGRHVRAPSVLYLQEPSRWLYEAQPELAWAAPPPNGRAFWTPRGIKNFLHDTVRVHGFRVQAREEWVNARAFDAMLVNSFFSRESVLRTYGVDARVCYLGVDNSKFVNLHLPRENFVVGVGAVAPRKNVRLVIESLALIGEPQRPRLVWIGDTSKPEHFEELKELARARRVDFVVEVRITDDALIDYLNRAAMMVYTPRLEPFGYAPLEANACGMSVVGVAEGGLKETVVDGVTGLLVEHDDPHQIAAAVEHLLRNPDVASKLGENGERLVAERWTVDAAAGRLEGRLLETLQEVRAQRGSTQKGEG
ncbi:MAG TPA: glycosyltransferase family 4 protein [Pyrinomonadaceae bacterium]